MNLRILAGLTATVVAAGLVVAVTAPAAQAAATVVVVKADFVPALADTRSAGHLAYQANGLHLWTDNASGQAKVAEYIAVSGSLADMVGSTPPAWTGTNPGPGGQIMFDADGITGNGNDFNILVGETVYDNGNDWWLTPGSSTAAKAAAPLTTGGSGSTWHGTIADWATALPDARVYAVGFSLGSGVLGDGVMSSMTYGSTTYTFAHGLGHCAVAEDYPSSTVRLLADCDTDIPLWAQSGWTVDGDGHKITALETPTTTFSGAVLQNEGPAMNVRDLTVTTNADWNNASKNSGGNLAGIRLKDASGQVENVTISGISHGNGVQEGNALDVENFGGATTRNVTVDGVTIARYQKTGIRINGNVTATVTNSTVGAAGTPTTGAPLDHAIAANSLQVSRGANAVVRNNKITGNEWDGDTVWSASAALFFQAGNVTFEQNVIGGPGVDFGVVSQDGAGTIKVRCNLVGRTADQAGDPDVWSTGIASYGDAGFAAVDNTIDGYQTPTDGATNVVNQGRCAPNAPAVTMSGITRSSATVRWTGGVAKPYAPVSGWELSGPSGIITLPAGTTTYRLSGLQAGRDYSVSVRAINVSGGSTWANARFTTPSAAAPSLRVKAKAKHHRIKVKVLPRLKYHKVVLFKVAKQGTTKVTAARTNAKSKAVFRHLSKGRYVVIAKPAPGYVAGTSSVVKVRRR